jgi:carotenoid cleavage dioxygenase-like enzyme
MQRDFYRRSAGSWSTGGWYTRDPLEEDEVMSSAPESVSNRSNQPFLSGSLFPVGDEIDVASCTVTGEIPEALRGTFMQNGPNPRFEPLGRYHMFDGDGMLHAISFEDGRVSYRNRWIISNALGAELKHGRALYHGLGEMTKFPDPEIVAEAGPIKNPANTHIVKHAGRYLALWEGGPPTEVKADLETVGLWTFDGKLNGGMTAHPRIDPRTGEMFSFAYSPLPPFLRYFVVDAQGNLVHQIELDIPMGTMMHDFIITDDYAVFIDSPICFNMAALEGGPMVVWKPENGTRIGVLPKFGQPDEMKWFEIENGHVQHFWNGWQEGQKIEFSGTRNPHPEFGLDTEGSLEESSANGEAGRATRFFVDLEKGTAGLEQFDDLEGDFCRFNDAYNGKRSRYHYMGGFAHERGMIGHFDAVVKYDDQTNERTMWYSGKGHHIGEAVYADDPARSGEDEGWLLVLDQDVPNNKSDLCILNAQDIAAGPIARIHMPHRLAFGFHVNWFPEEN